MSIPAHRLVGLLPDAPGTGPRYRELAEAIRSLIGDGRLLPAWRLPSERELAAAASMSRNTVAHAYDLLRQWGYVVSVRGSGSVVRAPMTPEPPAAGRGPRRPGGAPEPAAIIDLTRASPEAAPEVIDAYRTALEALPPYLRTCGYEAAGLVELREAVADRYAARGLPTHPDQVVVTNGAVSAIAVVARAFVETGDRAVVETPGYPTAVAALRRAGARVVGVTVGEHGVDPGDLASVARQTAPRLTLLTPDFHNPTGALMPQPQRAAIAGVLARERVLTVVDETLAEVCLDPSRGAEGMPAPYAACAGDAADVVTVGGLSKSHWGGLRVGWLRVPPAHFGAVLAARTTLDLGVPVLEQLAAAELLRRSPGLTPARARGLRDRRDALGDALTRHCPEWTFRLSRGGLALWCALPAEGASALAAQAGTVGVRVVPGPVFSVDGLGLQRFVRLPYTLAERDLREAVERLAAAWSTVRSRAAGRRTASLVT